MPMNCVPDKHWSIVRRRIIVRRSLPSTSLGTRNEVRWDQRVLRGGGKLSDAKGAREFSDAHEFFEMGLPIENTFRFSGCFCLRDIKAPPPVAQESRQVAVVLMCQI